MPPPPLLPSRRGRGSPERSQSPSRRTSTGSLPSTPRLGPYIPTLMPTSARSSSRSASPSREPYFYCPGCAVPRPNRVRSRSSVVCQYCEDPSGSQRHEVRWCFNGRHETYRTSFFDDFDELDNCRLHRVADDEVDQDSQPSSVASTPRGSPQRSPEISESQRVNEEQMSFLQISDPPIDLDNVDLNAPAVSDRDWQLVNDFHAALDADVMEECDRCHEKWFNLRLKRLPSENVCSRCRGRDTPGKRGNGPCLMSAQNHMDPGDVPSHLPQLTQIEEILIARVHSAVELWQARGQQWKYKGHVIHFLRDVAKVYDQLPLLPEDIDVVLLRPAGHAADERVQRQFRREFRVRQAHIRIWLQYLKINHAGYRYITIREDRLTRLPVDGDVSHRLPSQEVEDSDDQAHPFNANDDESDEAPDAATVPDLLADHTEIEMLRQQALPPSQRQNHIEMAPFQSTPLSEFNRSQALLSCAFPTLFPSGQAEFVLARERTVDYKAYLEHLLRYRDSRFAQHPRFRYVAFNTLMRRQVNARSNFFAKRHVDNSLVDVDALREAFATDSVASKRLLSSVVRFAGNLTGTRPYWGVRRQQLEAIVRELDCPPLFSTYSAADTHWESLAKLMPNFEAWKRGTAQERARISRKNLTNNPHIAVYHIVRRFTLFMERVIAPKFNVKDWWNRWEYQGRGSGHDHGFIWGEGMATINNVDNENSRTAFAAFWDKHVTAINPEPGHQENFEQIPPMQSSFEEQTNTIGHLSAVINRVQRHRCTDAYCLRLNKRTQERSCRFYFPRKERFKAEVTNDLNPKHWIYAAANAGEGPRGADGKPRIVKHDGSMNHYVRAVTLGWLANTDESPCTSKDAVINYIGKYASKSEKKTAAYVDLMKQVLPRVTSNRPVVSAAAKLMNKVIAERDWSSQEVVQILLGIPLVSCSRTIINVDCRPERDQNQAFVIHDGEVEAAGLPALQKYKERDRVLYSDLTYLEFLRHFNFTGKQFKRRPRAAARVLNFWPRYKADPQGEQFEDYCRVKLMLNHPFKEVEDLKSGYETFTEAWQRVCHRQPGHEHPEDHFNAPLEAPDDEFEEFEDEDIAPTPLQGHWEDLAAQRPGGDNAIRIEDPDLLGHRDVDRSYDWSRHVGLHPTLDAGFWQAMKEQYPAGYNVEPVGSSAVDKLNFKQRQVYDTVMSLYQKILDGRSHSQLLLNVDGPAGSGKSFLIQVLSARLQDEADCRGLECSPVIRLAPTGVAAFGINGRTLHSLLRLPVRKGYADLSASNLASLQGQLRGCDFLVIDEKSMIGLCQLYWIDQRLRQAFPHRKNEPFGGLNILLFGDFFQLPPIMEKALYNNSAPATMAVEAIAGRNAYLAFDQTVELDEIMRQQGTDTSAIRFRYALNELRHNTVTRTAWQTLSTRTALNLPPTEVDTFKDALHIYGKKVDVRNRNHNALRDLQTPVKEVLASHIGSGADKVSYEDAGNLHASLTLCIGAKVMLVENLWTERGLMNGAIGFVRELVWQEDQDPSREAPFAVLVAFRGYTGPSWGSDSDGTPIVPIFRAHRDFYKGATTCRRTQFPLTLSYAITIHKAQGMTLGKVVLNLAEPDFAAGLTYVAISRVKTLSGLLFEEPFDYERLKGKPSTNAKMRKEDFERRSGQHL